MMKVLAPATLAIFCADVVAADDRTIGISVRSWQEGRFTDRLVPLIEAHAAEHGYSVVMMNADDSIDGQAGHVAEMVEQGFAGIVVGLVNSDAAPQVGAAAAASQTPLVYMNVAPISQDDLPVMQSYVGPDEAGTGEAQALAVCASLPEGGNVGLLIGSLTHPAAAARTRAFEETIASPACDGVELTLRETAQWNREFAAEVTGDWIASGEILDAVVANNDHMALGAADAFASAGIDMDNVFIAGVDGLDVALDAIESGALDATYLQELSTQAGEIFATLDRMMTGEAFEPLNLIPMVEITQYSNVVVN